MDVSEEEKRQLIEILAEHEAENERRALVEQEMKSRMMAGFGKAEQRRIAKSPLVPERVAPPSPRDKARAKKRRKAAKNARRKNR